MTTPKIDTTKPVQTKEGWPVSLFRDRHEGSAYPLVGIMHVPDGTTRLRSWTLTGRNDSGDLGGFGVGFDLMNVPPKKRAVYVNFTSRGLFDGAYADRYGADHFASHDRAACIRVEYAEGQYDD